MFELLNSRKRANPSGSSDAQSDKRGDSQGRIVSFSLYAVLSIDAGHNLNKPTQISGTPVNLTHYNGSIRAVFGAKISAKDNKSDTSSLTASYRVRFPTPDEPLVRTSLIR